MLANNSTPGYLAGCGTAKEIAAAVERAVGAGRLEPGEALPPIRAVAEGLRVNHNTVAAAYRTLRRRGVIETAGRRGSRVRHTPATTPRKRMAAEVVPGSRDVASGNPDPDRLPRLSESVAPAPTPLLYGAPSETAELRDLAASAFRDDGVAAGPIAVTSGTLDAMEKALLAHTRPGDAVAVEDPGWHSLLDLLGLLDLTPLPVAVDDDGPRLAPLVDALRQGARAVVVTNRAQNPFGSALGADRASRLRAAIAEHPGALVIEDDHGYAFTSAPFAWVAPPESRWMLVRSCSKSFGPDLRTAVVTGDTATVDSIRARQRITQGWVSHLLQRRSAAAWRAHAPAAPDVAAHYDQRREALLGALARRGIDAHGRSGLNVWLDVPDEAAVVTRLANRGWTVSPGARFRVAASPGIRVTIASLPAAEAESLAEAIAASLHPHRTVREE